MKSLAKFLLVGAVAVMVIAISAVPSEAAKKKAKATAAAAPAAAMPVAATGCGDGGLCSTQCDGNGCKVNFCGADKQWYPAILTPFCIKGQCPPPCN